jgi:putative protease
MVTKTYRKAIDDYVENPDNWKAENYLDDLYSISNRGFSLAFADGDLKHFANNYDSTKSISEYEFAGYVTEVGNDYFCMLVKNKLVKNDVVNFISPKGESITISIPELIDAENGNLYNEVNSGLNRIIKIPFDFFKNYSKELLPVFSVAKKIKKLSDVDSARLELDKESYRIEMGYGSVEKYNLLKSELLKTLENK